MVIVRCFYLDTVVLAGKVCAPAVDCATTASLFGVKLTQKPVVIRHHGRAVMVRSRSVLWRVYATSSAGGNIFALAMV